MRWECASTPERGEADVLHALQVLLDDLQYVREQQKSGVGVVGGAEPPRQVREPREERTESGLE